MKSLSSGESVEPSEKAVSPWSGGDVLDVEMPVRLGRGSAAKGLFDRVSVGCGVDDQPRRSGRIVPGGRVNDHTHPIGKPLFTNLFIKPGTSMKSWQRSRRCGEQDKGDDGGQHQ